MRSTFTRCAVAIAATVALYSSPHSSVAAQGRGPYLNFETPQVKPICVARIGNHDFLLACNTPDSSLEIYDCETNRLVDRVGVGLEPVSVRWNARLSRAYTTNMIGDSVTSILLRTDTQGRLTARLDRSEWVGDEPMDIAFSPSGAHCFVTLGSGAAFAWLDATTLQPLAAWSRRIQIFDSWGSPTQAIKEPRQILVSENKLWILGAKGNRFADPSPATQINLWSVDLATFAIRYHGRLGTMGLGLAATSSGQLFVASGEAQNQLAGEAAVAAAPFGFVESWLQRLENPASSTPTIVRRNLNQDFPTSSAPVRKQDALAHPTDIAIIEDAAGDADKVYVTAFHSNRIGVITNTGDSNANNWRLARIDLSVAPGSTNKLCGPRGIAYKAANPLRSTDPGARLYVLNRLDNSISVLDPSTDRWLETFALQHDPTPAHVRNGRPFLYSADLSGNGFVSCASCHPDGRLDGQLWDLGATVPTDPFPSYLLDGAAQDGAPMLLASGFFTPDKGVLATQSLQGLLNWEVEPGTRAFVSNQPYHWRGDRPQFEAFNGAFKGLLGGSELSADDMRRFRDMVNSIHYPSNPEQPLNRRYSGSLGDPADEDDGTGALAGMKLFHIAKLSVCQSRACVHCHSLPEGSNNRITEVFGRTGGGIDDHPLETAALRGLLPKERAVVLNDLVNNPGIPSPSAGLDREGLAATLNAFNRVFAGANQLGSTAKADLVNQFNREFDWGVAPLVGVSITLDAKNITSPIVGIAFGTLETSAHEANSGFVVQAWSGSSRRGFAYDPTSGSYTDVSSGAELSRANVISLIQSDEDRLVLVGTPLGSERRLAHPKGQPNVPRGPRPSAIELQPMRPNTAYREVPLLENNWDPAAQAPRIPFTWTAKFSDNTPVPEPPFLRTIRLYQWGLKNDGPSFGLTKLRHDAPRRFRVAGKDIRPGAVMILRIPKKKPPYDNIAESWPIVLPIYPTDERTPDGRSIWETAVEFEPLMYYGLMLGGPAAPGVVSAWQNNLPEPPIAGTFDPQQWNKHHVTVVNADISFSSGGWQALRIQ